MIGWMRRAKMSSGNALMSFVGLAVRLVDACCGQMDGTSPLYAASQNGHVEAVRALVELGAAVSQADVGSWDVMWAW
jgi:hypothetical protein